VQYLVHLSECHDWVANACRRNAGTISEFFYTSKSPPSQSAQPDVNELQNYVDDFEYLANELDKQILRIQTLKTRIIEQADLLDKRRNKLVGLLIAVYVPLAFATVSSYMLSMGTSAGICANQYSLSSA
jgi:hypothetical protein